MKSKGGFPFLGRRQPIIEKGFVQNLHETIFCRLSCFFFCQVAVYCSVYNLVCMHSRVRKCHWLLKVALVLRNVACGAASTSGSASFFELGSGWQLESPGLPSTAQGRCYQGKALQAPPQSLGVASQLQGGSTGEVQVVQGEASPRCCVQHTASMD